METPLPPTAQHSALQGLLAEALLLMTHDVMMHIGLKYSTSEQKLGKTGRNRAKIAKTGMDTGDAYS